jgi:hypothetical protein
MKLWKMKKSSDFDHEKIDLVKKYVGTPAILGRTLDLRISMPSSTKSLFFE